MREELQFMWRAGRPPPQETDAERAASGRHAARVAAGILVTRVLGYVRERVFAHYFGNAPSRTRFARRFASRNALRTLLGEGTLSASFIPVYAALTKRTRWAAGARRRDPGLLLLAAVVLAVSG